MLDSIRKISALGVMTGEKLKSGIGLHGVAV